MVKNYSSQLYMDMLDTQKPFVSRSANPGSFMDKPFKIAAIVTTYLEMSHADVIVSRWLEPHARDSDENWHPTTQITSLYIEQQPEESAHGYSGMHSRSEPYDHSLHIGRAVVKYYNVFLAKTVHEALTLGGDSLAVDAVLFIGEHGSYPLNDLGQKLYPRKELFLEILAIMRESERSVPVFCDKHYSWDVASAHAMVEEARKLQVPLFAGSSIEFAGVESGWPKIASKLEEMVFLFSADLEAYGYHSLEFAQSLLDRRPNGRQHGIAAVTALKGAQVWEASTQGIWSKEIQTALLRRCYPEDISSIQIAEPNVAAFHIEYIDGVKASHLFLPKHRVGFQAGMKLASGEMLYRRTRTHLTGTFFSHFAALNREIEKFFLTRQPPYPPERVLLTTCTLAKCMAALKTPGVRHTTPELAIAY